MDENPYKSPESDGTGGHSSIEKALEKIDELFELWNHRIGIMLCVVIAALVTPADPFSLFFVAVPLIVLYFFVVGLRAWKIRTGFFVATLAVAVALGLFKRLDRGTFVSALAILAVEFAAMVAILLKGKGRWALLVLICVIMLFPLAYLLMGFFFD